MLSYHIWRSLLLCIGVGSAWVLPAEPVRKNQFVIGNRQRLRPQESATPYGRSKAGVGKLPALGFNSWNAFHCNINEAKFLDAASKLIELGLKDVGYEYVNVDDCWSVRDRRDADSGYLIPDTDKFPHGISGLANKVHDMGLKLGIYSSAGDKTCAGFPASLEHESIDAKAFSEWGVDYLKYDNCNFGGIAGWVDECEFCQQLNGTCQDSRDVRYCSPDYDYSKSKSAQRFKRMRDALNSVERPMLYSFCSWGRANVNAWAPSTGQSWRTTDDIEPSWGFVLRNLNQNTFALQYADFYNHPDPDMLEVGNGLTPAEERTHFALWAAMKSPLLIGTDLTRLSRASLEILKSKALLEFNQDDTHGKPAVPFRWGTNQDWTFDDRYPAEYWSGQYKGGVMVLLFNNHDEAKDMTFSWDEVPQIQEGKTYRIVDGWDENRDYDCFVAEGTVTFADIDIHDTAVLVLKEGECETVLTPGISQVDRIVLRR